MWTGGFTSFYFTVYHAPFQAHQRQSPHDWFTGLYSFPNHHPLTVIILSLTERLKLLQGVYLVTPVHLHIVEGDPGRRRFQSQNSSLQQHVCWLWLMYCNDLLSLGMSVIVSFPLFSPPPQLLVWYKPLHKDFVRSGRKVKVLSWQPALQRRKQQLLAVL